MRLEEVVRYSEEPDSDFVYGLTGEFDALDASERYRGKFALWFLRAWLDQLGSEYKDPTSKIFSGMTRVSKVRSSELVASNFASSSPLPKGFVEFIDVLENGR